MPFKNSIIPGGVLYAPSLKTPNYVAGTSGWYLAQNGSAEFNGPLTVNGTTALNGDTTVSGALGVSGSATVSGSINVSGDISFPWAASSIPPRQVSWRNFVRIMKSRYRRFAAVSAATDYASTTFADVPGTSITITPSTVTGGGDLFYNSSLDIAGGGVPLIIRAVCDVEVRVAGAGVGIIQCVRNNGVTDTALSGMANYNSATVGDRTTITQEWYYEIQSTQTFRLQARVTATTKTIRVNNVHSQLIIDPSIILPVPY